MAMFDIFIYPGPSFMCVGNISPTVTHIASYLSFVEVIAPLTYTRY